ncbi:fluoride efflux transporter FluC [Nocardioides montaniterrae]
MTDDRQQIRRELHGLPIDPEPTLPLSDHPVDLVRRDADLLPVIALGGALGALARWGMAHALPATGFAWSTVTTNLVGCALIGVLMALMIDRWSHTRFVRPFLGVGVLGGFTTFSTSQLDTHRLLADGRPAVALAYVATTLVGGVLAVWLGLVGTRKVLDR